MKFENRWDEEDFNLSILWSIASRNLLIAAVESEKTGSEVTAGGGGRFPCLFVGEVV